MFFKPLLPYYRTEFSAIVKSTLIHSKVFNYPKAAHLQLRT